jgi:biotin-(acetyl-CoA carboxylase) ligase
MAGSRRWDIVIAEVQKNSRGRLEGTGIHKGGFNLSVILNQMSPCHAARLTLMTGLAVAIPSVLLEWMQYKGPNDIFVIEKK